MIHLLHKTNNASLVTKSLEVEDFVDKVFYLEDDYSVGNWQCEGAASPRKLFWDSIKNYNLPASEENEHFEYPFERDKKCLAQIQQHLADNPNEQLCFWFGYNSPELAMYLYALPFFSTLNEKLWTIHIDNLPFFDADQRIFFPKKVSEIEPNELKKCATLLHQLSEAEIELDIESSRQASQINGIRQLIGTKELEEGTFEKQIDEPILQYLSTQKKARKIEKLISHIQQKQGMFSVEIIASRVDYLVRQAKISEKKETTKLYIDREVSIYSEKEKSIDTPDLPKA